MRDGLWTKGLAVGIIILFVGTTVVSSVAWSNTANVKVNYNQSIQTGVKETQSPHHVGSLGTGSWWNTSWSYCRILPIINPNDSYQMKIIIGKFQGGTVNCFGHCRDDFGDIRFVDIDNVTVLSYWIENYTFGSQATFWVKSPDDVQTEDAIMLYYDNPNATSLSDGNTTFLTYINNTAGWIGDNQTLSMFGGRLRYYDPQGYAAHCSHSISTDNNYDIIVEIKIEEIMISDWECIGFGVTDGSSSFHQFTHITSDSLNWGGYFGYVSHGSNIVLYQPWFDHENWMWREDVKTSTVTADYYMFKTDGSLAASALNTDYADGSASTISYVDLGSRGGYATSNAYITWIRVRKYASPEPLWGTPGNETTFNLPPIANFTYSPINPKNMTIVQFNDLSIDTDGFVATWWWDFGDGYFSNLTNPDHFYSQEKNYNVTLTVADNYHATDTMTKPITILPLDRTIASLQSKWNLISISYTKPINKTEITVRYNGTDFNWSQATTSNNPTGEPIILKSIYGWNKTTQAYILSDILNPRYGCWMYAYHNCTLLRPMN
jgi:PKD repeat protein